jgi:short-subunit dehydrogenase
VEAFRARYGPVAAVLGAGQGIGRAFALALAARGLDLLLVDVARAPLDAVCAEAEAAGARARGLVLDLGTEAADAALAAEARQARIGLAVYTAVRSLVGPFLDETPGTLRTALAVNCGGAQAACRALAPPMVERGRGGIVLLSSLAGLQGTGFVAAYAAAKAFDLTLAEALWWELGEAGVDVLGLVAGSTDTPGFRAGRPRLETGAVLDAPEAVAREGLDHLADGPVWICGEGNRRIAEALAALPRRERVGAISASTRALFAGPPGLAPPTRRP